MDIKGQQELEGDKELAVALAGLLSKGWVEEFNDGRSLTDLGEAKAHKKWMQLSTEDRALLGMFIMQLLDTDEIEREV